MTLLLGSLSELHKMGIQIKNGEYIQYQNYTRKSQKVYRRSYGAFCGFLKDSSLSSIEKDNEVLKHYVYQKYFWPLGRIKERCDFRLVKVGDILDILKSYYFIN